MQSSTYRRDHSYISLGERRGKSDLARFSLDLSWTRAVSDGAHSRAYPSPPMSGSPPLPPRRNPDSSDRGHGSYGSTGQDVFRGTQTSQPEHPERSRAPPLRAYQEALPQVGYPPYRMEDIPPQVQYQPRPQMQPQQQQQVYAPVTTPQFSTAERPSIGETPDFSSPKAQRKTKGHVASACVPCKRAHLRSVSCQKVQFFPASKKLISSRCDGMFDLANINDILSFLFCPLRTWLRPSRFTDM